MAILQLAAWLPAAMAGLAAGTDIGAAVPVLIVIALASVAIWLLHRQSARVASG